MTGVSLEFAIDMHHAQAMLRELEDFEREDIAEEIGDYIVSETVERFRNESDPDGEAWLPSQRALKNGDLTLTDFGHLRDSITYLASSDQVEVGSDLVYAAIHQFGGVTGRNGATELPARPYLGLNAEDEAEIDAIVEDYLRGALR